MPIRIKRVLAAPMLLLMSSQTFAQTSTGGEAVSGGRYNIVFKAGGGYTDNVNLLETGGGSSIVGLAGIELNAVKDTGRLQLDALADLLFLHYFDEAADRDNIEGNLSAELRYEFVPDRLEWIVAEEYAQVREDFQRPFSPGNRQSYNTFTTGPDIIFRLGSTLDLTTELRYSRRDFEDSSTLDSQTYTGRLVATRRLSSRAALSLVIGQDRLDSEPAIAQQADPDFDRREVALRWSSGNARTQFSLEGGISEVDGPTVDDEGPVIRASLNREITRALSLQLGGARQFSITPQQEQLFRRGDALSLTDDLLLPASEPYEETSYSVGLGYKRPRTTLSLAVSRSDSEYRFVSSLNRTTTSVEGRAQRRLTPRTDFDVRIGRSNDEIIERSYDVTETFYGAGLRWRLTRSFALSLSADRRKRRGGVFGDNYTSTYGNLLVRYSPWTPDSGIEAGDAAGGSGNRRNRP